MARPPLVPLVVVVLVVVLDVSAAGEEQGTARIFSGLPQHFLHPFINFWEVHYDPEVFPKLNGANRVVGTATMALIFFLGWLGYLPITIRQPVNTDRLQNGDQLHPLLRNWLAGGQNAIFGRRQGKIGHRNALFGRRQEMFGHRNGALRRRQGTNAHRWKPQGWRRLFNG